ncbi:MAG: 3-deoxy-D-manno-octulosonic acid transferase [Sedimentisphaerales bacterium]|nr:3-deoxy-D-manno-octulosonic acid transferase [Sedimentisphaerales bacterium]
MKFIVNFIYLLGFCAISPIVVYRMLWHNRYHVGWGQRFGRIDRKYPDKKCLWLHAVSLGEVNAAKTIIAALEKNYPDHEIAISATTDTGYGRANELYGGRHTVFYFPLDFSFTMRRAFDRIRPALCLLMELEVWYNFSHIAASRNIPIIVVNGRLSERSLTRYRRIRPLIKSMFENLSLVLAQTKEYALRFKYLGCPEKNILVTGSLKYDTAHIADTVDGANELSVQLCLDRQSLWVAGGTGPGEEEIILDIYRLLKQDEKLKNLRLAIVPRKPERFDEVAQLITQYGFEPLRYSEVKQAKNEKRKTKNDSVILGDTMGDLRKFYSLATVVFVGRTLVPMGGSDMMEAAALNKCTIIGPYAFNFQQTVDALRTGDGVIMVKDKNDLLEAVKQCFLDPAMAARIAANGQNVIRKNQGATAASIAAISKIISVSRTTEHCH